MDVQVISRDGEPEYAILPWDQYQALLRVAGLAQQTAAPVSSPAAECSGEAAELPGLDQLATLREAKGLERAQLARTVGISPSYLQLIETGVRKPDAAIRRSLAWELGVAGWRGEA